MARKKSFEKHAYVLIAIIVLLIAAGIASYGAVVPDGSATHGDLYVNNIYSKGEGAIVLLKDELSSNRAIRATVPATGLNLQALLGENEVAGSTGVKGVGTSIGVEGGLQGSGNTGKLGTATAGVEGRNTNGNDGLLGATDSGVKGVAAADGTYGVYGVTSQPNSYAGRFAGGKGLYASRIEFGADAFDAVNTGYLILGAPGGTTCTNVCKSHGASLSCSIAARITDGANLGCSSTTGARYCWCD